MSRQQNRGPLFRKIAAVSAFLVFMVMLTVAASLRSQQMLSEHMATAPDLLENTEALTEPPMEKIATANILSTGDLMFHASVISSGLDKSTGSYDYSSIFDYIAPYVDAADYAVANLEGTLAGNSSGYEYAGSPRFNIPDAVVEAAKNAGFDMLLTANDHSYDTGTTGFHRTQQVIARQGLDHLGTRQKQEDASYIVKDINGIRLGMICYTYVTGVNSKGNKTVNDLTMTVDDSNLINSFTYEDPDRFYSQVEEDLIAMGNDGADCTVVYIHWGTEFQATPDDNQLRIGQALCNLGADIIIGSNPRVAQPLELLQSENDPDHHALCLYSLGTAVSNFRQSKTYPVESEDGMLFTFTLAKYSDGSVVIECADVLPTWVNRHKDKTAGKNIYPIVPLDASVSEWSDFGVDSKTLPQAQSSLARTEAMLTEGLQKVNAFFYRQQTDHETAIGVEY